MVLHGSGFHNRRAKSASAAAGPLSLRGSNLTTSSGTSNISISLPVGCVSGDIAVLYYGGGWQVTVSPTGWTALDTANTGNWSPGLWWKQLNASDIAGGTVSFTVAGSFDFAVGIAVTKAGSGIRAWNDVQAATGGAGNTLTGVTTTDATPAIGDYAIYFGSRRSATTVITSSRGSQLQASNNGGAASAAIFGEVLASAGIVSNTITYTATAVSDARYTACVVVKP